MMASEVFFVKLGIKILAEPLTTVTCVHAYLNGS